MVAREDARARAFRGPGGEPVLVSPGGGKVQGFNHLDKGDTFNADRKVSEADVSDYDGLVLPGGVANPDFLRLDQAAVQFVRSFLRGRHLVGNRTIWTGSAPRRSRSSRRAATKNSGLPSQAEAAAVRPPTVDQLSVLAAGEAFHPERGDAALLDLHGGFGLSGKGALDLVECRTQQLQVH